MEKIRNNAAWIVKLVLSGIFVFLVAKDTKAATIDWKGTTNSNWATGTNWSSGSAPASGDAVRIGVVAFTNQPTLNSGATTTIASLTFGTFSNITLTINSGFVLAVTGGIIQNPSNSGNITTVLAGAGSLTSASLQVGNTTTFPPILVSDFTQVTSTISSFHVTGNVTVNSTDFGILFLGVGFINATFSLQGGTTLIDGTILTVNTNSGVLSLVFASPVFSIDMPTGSALNPILKLSNTAPINTASVTGSIDFYNNTGGTGTCTVNYNGASQTVYTTTTTNLDASPQTYQNLLITGSGTATVGAGAGGSLTVGNDFTTSAPTVLLNTNNPTVTVTDNWVNSSNVTQGSGNITISNTLQNNANTITCGIGALTVGASGIQINAGALTLAGGTVTDNGLLQNNGGALNCGSGSLIIYGLYQNNSGTFTAGSGTVYFSGAGQSLTDGSSGTVFNNVTFNGSGTAVMNAGVGNFGVSSTGILTMVSPVSLTAGSASTAYLTLKSDTNGTATVANIPAASSITGYVTVQRFVQGSALYDAVKQRWKGRNYRLMSSQVNEGADVSGNRPSSLNYLGASTIITDCTSSFGTTTGNPSLYFYNELYTPSNSSFTSGNFIGVTNISSTTAAGTISTTDATTPSAKIYVGEGFMMYFRGDKVTHIAGSPSKTKYPYVTPESVTFSATGNLNQGTYSARSWTGAAGLLYTTSNFPANAASQGYNLVGNPYPSSIDWSTFSNTISTAAIYGPNVDPTIYILNPVTNNYDTYNASTNTSTGTATKTVPSGQGFFVHAKGTSPTLTFKKTAKTNTLVTGSNLLMSTQPPALAVQQLLRLKLAIDSLNYDDIVIGFNAGASAKYNYNEDSAYLPGLSAPEGLSSLSSDSVNLSVNFLPLPKQSPLLIRLNVEARKSGAFTLLRTQLDAIPKIYQVWLMDNYKKDSLDLRNNTTYVFNIDKTDMASFGNNRFSLIIRQDPALAIHLLDFTAAKALAGAQLTWKTENEQNYTKFTVERSTDNGQTFDVLSGLNSSKQGTYSYVDKDPVPGANQYRIKIEDMNGTMIYTKTIALIYGENGNSLINANISVYPNPAFEIINMTINQVNSNANPRVPILPASNTLYGIKIINIMGDVVKTATSAQAAWQYDVSTLSPGTYIIQVVNNSDKKVIGKSLFTKL